MDDYQQGRCFCFPGIADRMIAIRPVSRGSAAFQFFLDACDFQLQAAMGDGKVLRGARIM